MSDTTTTPNASESTGVDPEDPIESPETGEAGRQAISQLREAAKAANREAAKLRKELEALRAATMTDQEKAVAQAREEARREATAESRARLLRLEVRAAAAGKLADPGDAVFLLGDDPRFVDEDGEPNTKAIGSAIDRLLQDKPYLAANGSKPGALAGGGARPAQGSSLNDWIRTGR